jgi:hypothetical protein
MGTTLPCQKAPFFSQQKLMVTRLLKNIKTLHSMTLELSFMMQITITLAILIIQRVHNLAKNNIFGTCTLFVLI